MTFRVLSIPSKCLCNGWPIRVLVTSELKIRQFFLNTSDGGLQPTDPVLQFDNPSVVFQDTSSLNRTVCSNKASRMPMLSGTATPIKIPPSELLGQEQQDILSK